MPPTCALQGPKGWWGVAGLFALEALSAATLSRTVQTDSPASRHLCRGGRGGRGRQEAGHGSPGASPLSSRRQPRSPGRFPATPCPKPGSAAAGVAGCCPCCWPTSATCCLVPLSSSCWRSRRRLSPGTSSSLRRCASCRTTRAWTSGPWSSLCR